MKEAVSIGALVFRVLADAKRARKEFKGTEEPKLLGQVLKQQPGREEPGHSNIQRSLEQGRRKSVE